MKKPIAFAIPTGLLLVAGLAQTADTTELKVRGVIRPAACAPTLTSNGVIDYDTMRASSLQTGMHIARATKKLSLSIACDVAAQVSLAFTDKHAAHRLSGVADTAERFHFGLDGAAATHLVSLNGGATWSAPIAYRDSIGSYEAFAAYADSRPASARVLVMNMGAQALLRKPTNRPLIQAVPLSGVTTIEIKYL